MSIEKLVFSAILENFPISPFSDWESFAFIPPHSPEKGKKKPAVLFCIAGQLLDKQRINAC